MIKAYSETDKADSEDVPSSSFDSPTYVPDTISRCLELFVQVENVTTCVVLNINSGIVQ